MVRFPWSSAPFLFAALVAFAPGCSTAELTGAPDAAVDPDVVLPGSDAGVATNADGSVPTTDPDASVSVDAGPPVPSTAKVRIIVQPNTDNALVDALKAAKTSIHMTMYMLTADTIESTLIERHRAGVDVKVILNRNFPTNDAPNDDAFQKLQTAGVPVVWAPAAFRYTHSKSIVIDGTSLWVMTMNATPTSLSRNREFLAIDTEAGDITQAEAIFQGDFANRSATADGNLVLSPVNSQAKILALITSATKTVDLEGESLADTKVTDALVQAAKAGRTVRVVLSNDTSTTDGEQRAIDTLKQNGIVPKAVTVPYIHAKALVVDGKWAYVGSVNYTNTSFNFNRELGVITDDPTAVSTVQTTIAGDHAKGTAL
ncbi:MAG: phospholipase D-like domain-containing protein [Polyangiaceae bacterium]